MKKAIAGGIVGVTLEHITGCGLAVNIHNAPYIIAIVGLSLWAGYQRFLMMMIFNPDSAECEIARDWNLRSQMSLRDRINYETMFLSYIVFWPLFELGQGVYRLFQRKHA